MSDTDLEELLELLHRGGSDFRTLRATIVTWRDDDRAMEALHRSTAEAERRGMRTLTISAGSRRPRKREPRETTERTRIWYEPPERLRAETEGRRTKTLVIDGKHEFRTAFLGEEIVRGPLRSPYEVVAPFFLLRPWALLPSYRFEPRGSTEIAGRAAIDVRAQLRPGRRVRHLPGFSWGADEHRLAVDRERGALLRVAAFMDGDEYDVTEVTEVAFDQPIDPEIFSFEAPAGVQVITAEDEARRTRERFPRPRRNGLEVMAKQARFVLFAPPADGRPLGDRSTCFDDDCVTARYTQLWGDESHAFDVVLRPEVGDATPLETLSEAADGQLVARTVRDGTSIEVSSRTLGRERLLELVATL